jgi:putative hydroxymethylpyrimidine transport system substrate-binding protein
MHHCRSHAGSSRAFAALLTLVALLTTLFLVAAVTGCGGSESDTTASTTTSSGPTDSTAATTAAAAAPEVANVNLMMDWVPWVLDIPIDTAQEQGFYKQAGLTVTQTVPASPTDVVKFVSTGKSQFGLYYAPDLLMGVAEGAPLLSVGSLMPHAPVGMAMKPGMQASSPKDLEGKTAAVPLIPSTRASYETMLSTGGVDPAKVKLVDPGFNLVAPLLNGTFDSVAFTEFGELVEAELQSGQKLSYLDFRKWGTPDFAFLNIMTTTDFAKKNPATVRAFVRATFAGLAYAVANPEAAVDAYVKRHPELKKDLLLAQWKAAIPSMAAATGGNPAGWQDPAAWQQLDAWMVKTKLLESEVPIASAMTNDYLPPAQ